MTALHNWIAAVSLARVERRFNTILDSSAAARAQMLPLASRSINYRSVQIGC